MKTKFTTLMIKIDRVTVDSLLEVTGLAVKHRVPEKATVSIRTDATGTSVIFEWTDEPALRPGAPSPWSKIPNYYTPNPPNASGSKKPYKPF